MQWSFDAWKLRVHNWIQKRLKFQRLEEKAKKCLAAFIHRRARMAYMKWAAYTEQMHQVKALCRRVLMGVKQYCIEVCMLLMFIVNIKLLYVYYMYVCLEVIMFCAVRICFDCGEYI